MIPQHSTTALVEDALRRFREAAAEGKPTVEIFRCGAEAVEGEIAALREKVAVLEEQLAVATTRAQRYRDALCACHDAILELPDNFWLMTADDHDALMEAREEAAKVLKEMGVLPEKGE